MRFCVVVKGLSGAELLRNGSKLLRSRCELQSSLSASAASAYRIPVSPLLSCQCLRERSLYAWHIAKWASRLLSMATTSSNKERPQDFHRFVDEAGDMAFYHKMGRRRVPIVPGQGASACFMIGMGHVKEDLSSARNKIVDFCHVVESSYVLNYPPSVQKLIAREGYYYPHAKNDPPQLRHLFFSFIATQIDFSVQVVVGRKKVDIFERRHEKRESMFYADLMSHLIKDKGRYSKLILDVAGRGNTTANVNLQEAVNIARMRNARNEKTPPLSNPIFFNVQPYSKEPLLALTDYVLWAVQRVYEKGDLYFYNMLVRTGHVPLVFDPYNTANYGSYGNWYTPRNPLTEECWINRPAAMREYIKNPACA